MINYAAAFGVFASGELRNYGTGYTSDKDKEALKKCEEKFASIDDNLRDKLIDVAFGNRDYNEVKQAIRSSKK